MRSRGNHLAVSLAALVGLAVGATLVPTAPGGATPGQVKAGPGTATITITREDTKAVDQLESFATPGRTPVIGDFVGQTNSDEDNLDDILWYTPGAGGDVLWRTKGDRTWATTALSISGTFKPVVGRFSDDGKDDVIWYAPGSGADWLWDFKPDGSITKTQLAIGGTFTPIVGAFTDDGIDDVLWYAPGPAADAWWDLNADGTVTKRSLAVNGTFTPLVGSFSGSSAGDHVTDLIWYAPGLAPDAEWDFNADGTVTKRPLTVNGTYRPVVGNFSHDGYEDVIWYAPGTAKDWLWDFDAASLAKTQRPLTISGSYTPVTPSWGALFGDLSDQTDVLWFGDGSRPDHIWDFGTVPGAHVSRPITLTGDRTPVLARLEVVSWETGSGTAYSTGADVIDLHS